MNLMMTSVTNGNAIMYKFVYYEETFWHVKCMFSPVEMLTFSSLVVVLTAEDGCLEEFENTAAYSREYQSAQDCMCDSEHMFDCDSHNSDISESEIDQFVQQFQVFIIAHQQPLVKLWLCLFQA